MRFCVSAEIQNSLASDSARAQTLLALQAEACERGEVGQHGLELVHYPSLKFLF